MPDSAPATAAPATFSTDGLRFIRTSGLYATIATVGRDGAPHQARIWYRLEGETIVINSAVGRRWPTDLQHDPRISLTVAQGYDWVGLNGVAEPIEDQATAQADIAAMARAYETPEIAATSIARFRGERRISFHVHPQRVHEEFEE
ncbi:MAG: pyridoxamine 5'-phosphate oxidase family protein [Candidatus Limnocylindrales bacterium]